MQLKKHKIRLKYLLLLLMAIFFLSNRGFRALIKNYLEYHKLSDRKAELEHEKVRLEKEFKTSKDPGRIEQTARKDLGMKQPGEIEYRFEPPSQKDK